MGERCSHCEVTNSERSVSCTARDRLKGALHTYFKYTEFRPGQVESTVPGRDVFVRMATGSGKSLCMFLVLLAVSHQPFECADGPTGNNLSCTASFINSGCIIG